MMIEVAVVDDFQRCMKFEALMVIIAVHDKLYGVEHTVSVTKYVDRHPTLPQRWLAAVHQCNR